MYSDASEIYTALISHDRKIWRKEGEEDGATLTRLFCRDMKREREREEKKAGGVTEEVSEKRRCVK